MSSTPTYRLVRPAAEPASAPELDCAQRRVVEHAAGAMLVVGGPGTGKTLTLVEAAVARIEAGSPPDRVLFLAFDRRAASALRRQIARRLGRTSREPVARTIHSYAFAVLQRRAALRGERPPRLLTGPEQDKVIAELIAGDLEDDPGRWPTVLRPALGTRGFTSELRDLLMRASERGVTADLLRAWGRQHGRPEWGAAARFLAQYAAVTALSDDLAYDPAELVRAVLDAFAADPGFAAAEAARFDHVLVDDYAEADPAQEVLIRHLGSGATSIVVAGDPDQGIYSFRGADPEAITRFRDRPTRGGSTPHAVVLTESHRAGSDLVAAWHRAGAKLRGRRGHRDVVAHGPGGIVEAHVLRSPSQEAAFIAQQFRAAHLVDGVPWSDMAVIVRSTSRQLPTLRRALLAAGVPLGVASSEIPLVAQPAVTALLGVLRLAVRPQSVTEDDTLELMTSPVVGADSLALHRLRRELRKVEIAGGGRRSSPALLRAAIETPADLLLVDERAGAPAARLARLVAVARDAVAAGGDAEEVLWAVWAATGLADVWSRESLAGGTRGAAADADLDAVVALFDAVGRLVDRLPRSGVETLLDHLLGQQIPGDTLADRAPGGERVHVLTAHAAKGREWARVAVVGVQEGVWPDLRPRGSLLGSELLVDVAAGRAGVTLSRAAQMLDEERRLFYVACTRARHALLVTAVSDAENEPSRFLDEVLPWDGDTPRPPTSVPRSLSLPALVAELRAAVTDPAQPTDVREEAAGHLADLAAEGVAGADPSEWYGLRDLSDDAPLRGPGEDVRVSPSRAEQFDTCGLRWLLETAGGSPAPGSAQGIGTLVHDAATLTAQRELATQTALDARIDAGWSGLDLGGKWFSERERERARDMARKLLDWVRGNERELVGVEEEFEVKIGDAILSGRVDRLERDGEGRLVVVDLKTGKSAPKTSEVETNPQLGIYQLAVSEGGFDHLAPGATSGGAALVQLGARKKATEQRQQPLDEAVDPGWARALLERVATGMGGAVFTATVNDKCQMCPVRTSCPAHPDGAQVTS